MWVRPQRKEVEAQYMNDAVTLALGELQHAFRGCGQAPATADDSGDDFEKRGVA